MTSLGYVLSVPSAGWARVLEEDGEIADCRAPAALAAGDLARVRRPRRGGPVARLAAGLGPGEHGRALALLRAAHALTEPEPSRRLAFELAFSRLTHPPAAHTPSRYR